MCVYLKNIPAKFHPNPIWNDGALRFFEELARPNKNKMSSDMRSVPDLKMLIQLLQEFLALSRIINSNKVNIRHVTRCEFYVKCKGKVR